MQCVGLLRLPLRLANAVVDVFLGGLPDLDQPGIGGRRIVERPSINAQPGLGLWGEDVVDGRLMHPHVHLRPARRW